MTTKKFHGSCGCGRVTYEVELDLAKGTTKCNCTFCWKRRWWSAKVEPSGFRSIAGHDQITNGFCKHCGVRPYGKVEKAEWNDGEYWSINVACLDDLDPAELATAPVMYCDGRADNWWNPPAETRHL
jgi:hypothetical protein